MGAVGAARKKAGTSDGEVRGEREKTAAGGDITGSSHAFRKFWGDEQRAEGTEQQGGSWEEGDLPLSVPSSSLNRGEEAVNQTNAAEP